MMPSKLIISAPAKINLQFAVLGKRSDGYHEVETVMQKVDLVDEIVFSVHSEGLSLTCSEVSLPVDGSNLVMKAAESFFGYTGIEPNVSMHLNKQIPIAAGLGGGSSDAGSCLLGLNQLFRTELSDDELLALASPLGADVPFFVLQSTAAYATGIGNILHSIEPLSDCWILLVNPGISVSTKWVFDNFRLTRESNHYKLCGCLNSPLGKTTYCPKCQRQADAKKLFNDLEEVTIKAHGIIQDLKDQLLAQGAISALMTGSGATVFGVFEQLENAVQAQKRMEKEYSLVSLSKPFKIT